MAHPNEELARRGLEAFRTKDMATLNELFADDIVWHTPGRSPMAGDKKGKEAVFEFFQKTAEMTGGTFNVEIHAVMADDDHAVSLLRVSGQRDGKSLDMPVVQVLHIKEGKATEVWTHPLDLYAVDEFWS